MNAIAKQENTALQPVSPGEQNAVIASDVLIPRLLLMQGISPLVTSRKAQIGDLIRSTTGEKLGNPDKPVEIVPLKLVNTWINLEDTGVGQPKFRGQEERHVLNEHLPWEYEKEGASMKRVKAITLYALLPSDIHASNEALKHAIESGEAPDLDKTVMPIVISFQKTSYKYAGKKCASFFNAVRMNAQKVSGLAPYHYTLPLSCREEKKESNCWYVFDFGTAKPLKDKEIKMAAHMWAQVLGQSNLKVDDSQELDIEDSKTSPHGEMEL